MKIVVALFLFFFSAMAVACDGGCCNTVLWGNIGGSISSQADISTQLNLLCPKANPVFTGTIGTGLTAGRAMVTDSSGNLAVSSITAAQLAGFAPLASPTFTGTVTMPTGAGVLQTTSGGVVSSTTVDLTSQVANNLPASNGGTGVSTVVANKVLASPDGSSGTMSPRKVVAGDLSSGASADRLPLVTDGSGGYALGGQYLCAGSVGGSSCQTFMYDDGSIGQLSLKGGASSSQEAYIKNDGGTGLAFYVNSQKLGKYVQNNPIAGTAGGAAELDMTNAEINDQFWSHFPSYRTLLTASTASQVIFHKTLDIWTFIIRFRCMVRGLDAGDRISWFYYNREWTQFADPNTNTSQVIAAAGVADAPNLYSSNATFTDGNTNLTGYICNDSGTGNNWDFCIKMDNPSSSTVMTTVDCEWWTGHYN